jgi:hypothetical protein
LVQLQHFTKKALFNFLGWVTEEMYHKMKDAKEKNNLDLLIVVSSKRYKDFGLILNEFENWIILGDGIA